MDKDRKKDGGGVIINIASMAGTNIDGLIDENSLTKMS